MQSKWQNNCRKMTQQWQVKFRNDKKHDKAKITEKWQNHDKIIISRILSLWLTKFFLIVVISDLVGFGWFCHFYFEGMIICGHQTQPLCKRPKKHFVEVFRVRVVFLKVLRISHSIEYQSSQDTYHFMNIYI